MSRALVLLAAVLSLSSCHRIVRWVAKPEPIPANCSPECRVACPAATPAAKWESGTADELLFVYRLNRKIAAQNSEALSACEVRRQSCSACLERLEQAGVIK